MYSEEDYLMLSGIQHFSFCRRQWALIHIEQQWEENYRTTAGMLMHKNAHDGSRFEKRGDLMIARGLQICSRELGAVGQCDVVEFHSCSNGIKLNKYDGKWIPVPVEYKHGEPKERNEDILQLCAQAMCLEEMLLVEIEKGYLFYGGTKHRLEVLFSQELREEVIRTFMEMHQMYKRGFTPKVKTSKKCRACSLSELCIPMLNKKQDVHSYIASVINEIDMD